MKKRLIFGTGVLAGIGLAVALTPYAWYLAVGLARGEKFYSGMPTSFWRQRVLYALKSGIPAPRAPKSVLDTPFSRVDLSSVPLLLELTGDSDPRVRAFADDSLKDLVANADTGEVVPVLVRALEHPDVRVRIAVAGLLSNLLPIAPDDLAADAIPALRSASEDRDEQVRRLGRSILKHLGEETEGAGTSGVALRIRFANKLRPDRVSVEVEVINRKDTPIAWDKDGAAYLRWRAYDQPKYHSLGGLIRFSAFARLPRPSGQEVCERFVKLCPGERFKWHVDLAQPFPQFSYPFPALVTQVTDGEEELQAMDVPRSAKGVNVRLEYERNQARDRIFKHWFLKDPDALGFVAGKAHSNWISSDF
jgi:HEAT repeats